LWLLFYWSRSVADVRDIEKMNWNVNVFKVLTFGARYGIIFI
jgi:hypothetical protein